MTAARRTALVCSMLAMVSSCLTPICAAGLVRGLVVDRSDDFLWLGLPSPVPVNSMFNVMLVPGDKVIARAKALDCTPDAPYVSKATFSMKDRSAFIPVGAYVETTNEAVDDMDKTPGYHAVDISPRDHSKLTFQAGTILIANSTLSHETSSFWPTFGVSYRAASTRSVDLLLGAGYMRQDGHFTTGGLEGRRSFRALPITLDAKVALSPKHKRGWYGKLGAGAYIVQDERTVAGITTGGDSTRARFGWQAGLGFESRRGGFAQVTYMGVKSTGLRGVALSLGSRF